MATMIAAVDARCPLCGCSILTVGRSGHVTAEDLHPVMVRRHRGTSSMEGYMLCDDCGVLAELPRDMSLN
jgi:hypothetical protein